jgi:hypothetical protein
MGWWNKLAREAEAAKTTKRCLICDEICDKIYTTVKYRYENEMVSEVHMCETCSEKYDIEDMNIGESL